jgi:hypothetical protein
MSVSPDFYGVAFVAALILLAGVYLLVRLLVTELLRFRGKRLVTCPATLTPEVVQVKTLHAVMSSFFGEPRYRLKDCSRWSERRKCGQKCVRQIEAAPLGCLIRDMLERWYAGKDCAFCRQPLGHVDWYERQPAVRDEQGITREWRDIPATKIPEVLRTHLPVCWNCHIAERFRRQHPELVIERPRVEESAQHRHAS